MIEARLTDDLRFILFDTDKQKEIRTFPKKGIDPEKRENAETRFKDTKKKIQLIIDGQKSYLKRLFLTGEGIDAALWRVTPAAFLNLKRSQISAPIKCIIIDFL